MSDKRHFLENTDKLEHHKFHYKDSLPPEYFDSYTHVTLIIIIMFVG